MEKQKLIGKVFETSWGYDQTQYEFIKVISVSPSGKTVKCKRVTTEIINEESSTGYDAKKPTTETFGDEFRMKVDFWRDELHLRGSYPYCHDGLMKTGTRLDTFSEVEKDRTYAQTNPMFGH